MHGLRLWHRLFVATAAAVLTAVVLMLVVQQRTFLQGLLDYIEERESAETAEFIAALEGEYRQFGWARLRDHPERFAALAGRRERRGPPPPRRPGDGPGAAGRPPPPAPPPAEPAGRYALFDAAGQPVVGPEREPRAARAFAIKVDGVQVGTLWRIPRPGLQNDLDVAFARSQRQYGLFAALGIVVLLLPASWLFARKLASPLSAMALKARQIRQGDYSARVGLRRSDEIGRLAADFDEMAAALEEHRRSRQRWTAEISHELRTPLAVMRAEIEAMQDGLRPCDPTQMRSLADEVDRLGALVDDLYQLARADAGALDYRFEPHELGELVGEAVQAHSAALRQAGLSVRLAMEPGVVLRLDEARMRQLIGNLCVNTCRYTAAGGQFRITLRRERGRVLLVFEDSAPGVSDADLELLFEPLFRADASRSRAHGGAGLGLALVQRIAQAHGATIRARHSALGGLAIEIEWS